MHYLYVLKMHVYIFLKPAFYSKHLLFKVCQIIENNEKGQIVCNSPIHLLFLLPNNAVFTMTISFLRLEV